MVMMGDGVSRQKWSRTRSFIYFISLRMSWLFGGGDESGGGGEAGEVGEVDIAAEAGNLLGCETSLPHHSTHPPPSRPPTPPGLQISDGDVLACLPPRLKEERA